MTKTLKTILAFICALTAITANAQTNVSSQKENSNKTQRSKSRLLIDSAQYKITYQLKYVRDTANKENVRIVNMVLYPGHKSALFLDQDKAVYDSLYTEFLSRKVQDRAEKERIRNISRRRKSRYILAQDYPEKGSMLMQEYVGGNTKRYFDTKASQAWKIHDETEEILGYKCRKASCSFRGRDYVAWYTEDIPISRGPYMFTGLPGLIMKISSMDDEYDFTLIGFEKVSKPFPLEIFDLYVELVSREDFLYLKKYYNDNAAASLFDGLVKMKLTPEKQKELEKRLNRPRPYNPIEKE